MVKIYQVYWDLVFTWTLVIFLQLYACFYGQEDFLTGVKYKLPVLYPIDDIMASLLKKLGSFLVWMPWVMEMLQLSRA